MVTAYLLAVTAVTPLYGKLGDLYGRKVVLQVALVLFLVGSALCGLAQGMTELIAFRAVQGLGGGGLMVSAQAAIGDVVPPSERGRYSGLFGAVFGVSGVAGPLIGGFLTTHLSWRWIFYVNVPLGAVALGGLGAVFTPPALTERVRHQDRLRRDAALLAAGLASHRPADDARAGNAARRGARRRSLGARARSSLDVGGRDSCCVERPRRRADPAARRCSGSALFAAERARSASSWASPAARRA